MQPQGGREEPMNIGNTERGINATVAGGSNQEPRKLGRQRLSLFYVEYFKNKYPHGRIWVSGELDSRQVWLEQQDLNFLCNISEF